MLLIICSKNLGLLFLLLWNCGLVYSWHEVGHMTIAAIARFHLQKTELGTQTMEWADLILKPLVKFTEENTCPFVEGAVWADRIGAGGWDSMF